ncbi:ATP-binding cassette domain-containing protein [Devosia psychrophila]|uniref:ABC transporter n=1 Tax=Devosia psychrophila TaxID=728005 RepID=A0A1I1PMA4_9HYPH|nr:ABC transporter [Devosia psychrophila]
MIAKPCSRTNHAVKGIDLPVKKGECFGLVGESGCGKSTLLGAIAGRLKDWHGSITIAGDQLGWKKRNHDQLRRYAASRWFSRTHSVRFTLATPSAASLWSRW